jgi:hypothetical protein
VISIAPDGAVLRLALLSRHSGAPLHPGCYGLGYGQPGRASGGRIRMTGFVVRLRLGHNVTTCLAGSERFTAEKTRVGLRHRIGAIIVHFGGFLVH